MLFGPVPGRGDGRAEPQPDRTAAPVAHAIVDCAVYVDGHRLPGKFTHESALAEVRRRGRGFAWVGLFAPDEDQMDAIARVYGVHALAAEDAAHAHQRPKLERYDHMLFLVLRSVTYVAREAQALSNEIVETGEVMIFVGADFVITVRHGEHSGLGGVRQRLEQRPELLALGPGAVMHAVADHVVDTYLAVADAVGEDIETMETLVFEPRKIAAIEPIYLMKREVVELRRAVTPLSTPLQQLSKDLNLPLPKEVRRYFRDVADHQTAIAERVESYDEALSSLIHAALAKITMRQNADMRRISAWVAIVAVPTMIAGIYGMNFDNMPELRWHLGYPMTVGVMVTASSVLFALFRRNKWL
jgi:magnesium transporter